MFNKFGRSGGAMEPKSRPIFDCKSLVVSIDCPFNLHSFVSKVISSYENLRWNQFVVMLLSYIISIKFYRDY